MPKYATEKVLDRATAVTRDVVAPAAASIDEDATWPEEEFEDMRLHVTQRRHSHTGSRLAEQHVVQHRVGTMWAQLERTRQLVRSAAEAADRDDPDALPALTSAKAEVAECATDLVNDAMTMVGGIGYREHGTLGRRLRDARAAHVMSPTTDLLRLWTGRAVLGEHLLAD